MTKQQVIIYKGLPASGKTTDCKKWVDEDPINRVRVNKDDLRSLLHNGKYSKGNERQVLKVEESIILQALKDGYSVAIDNTHLVTNNVGINTHYLRIKTLLDNAGYYTDKDFKQHSKYVELIVKDFTDVSPEECIQRDLKRVNSVGSNVIWDMYWKNIASIQSAPISNLNLDAIIVDVDGTLASMFNRGPYDWSKVGNDKVRLHVRNLVNIYARAGYKILIVTGRDGSCLEATKDWLIRHEIFFDEVFIRQSNDTRKDVIVKTEIYNDYIKNNYNIHLVVDDRPQVIRGWKLLGLPVIDVDPCGKEF